MNIIMVDHQWNYMEFYGIIDYVNLPGTPDSGCHDELGDDAHVFVRRRLLRDDGDRDVGASWRFWFGGER